jgi:hypothetical protein
MKPDDRAFGRNGMAGYIVGELDWSRVPAMREKAVASMSKFDFLISPTSPTTAYAVDEATPGNATGTDPLLPHVEHKIETRCEAVRGFGYSHRQIAAE